MGGIAPCLLPLPHCACCAHTHSVYPHLCPCPLHLQLQNGHKPCARLAHLEQAVRAPQWEVGHNLVCTVCTPPGR
ncbi:hypothetical protein XENTR_v10019868 [Xenopus tropicalis]|nr:hypothetical protein XENTR_v10019868 [Xenopus tropicalis]